MHAEIKNFCQELGSYWQGTTEPNGHHFPRIKTDGTKIKKKKNTCGA